MFRELSVKLTSWNIKNVLDMLEQSAVPDRTRQAKLQRHQHDDHIKRHTPRQRLEHVWSDFLTVSRVHQESRYQRQRAGRHQTSEYGAADFPFILHVHLNSQQHRMDVELKRNDSVSFEEIEDRRVRRIKLFNRRHGFLLRLLPDANPRENCNRCANQDRRRR